MFKKFNQKKMEKVMGKYILDHAKDIADDVNHKVVDSDGDEFIGGEFDFTEPSSGRRMKIIIMDLEAMKD